MICSITFVGTGWPTCTSLDPPSVPFWKSDICSLPDLKDVSQWPWPFKGSWEWPQSDKSELPQYSWYILSGLLDLSLCSLLKCSLTWSFYTHCVLLAPDFSFTLRHLWLLKANLASQAQGKGDMEFPQLFLCHLSPAPLPNTAAGQYFSWSSFCYWCTFYESFLLAFETFVGISFHVDSQPWFLHALTVSLYSSWVPIHANWSQLPFCFPYFQKSRPY